MQDKGTCFWCIAYQYGNSLIVPAGLSCYVRLVKDAPRVKIEQGLSVLMEEGLIVCKDGIYRLGDPDDTSR
ncbi:MAG: hypothetical protein DRP08_01095 [Candidatus Aenigmatarchaeota archaeon]|nr:MAG: hypothetical protein DRP08_01095 [Candidatus Aenigmarchaeota archaeon]